MAGEEVTWGRAWNEGWCKAAGIPVPEADMTEPMDLDDIEARLSAKNNVTEGHVRALIAECRRLRERLAWREVNTLSTDQRTATEVQQDEHAGLIARVIALEAVNIVSRFEGHRLRLNAIEAWIQAYGEIRPEPRPGPQL